jgi:hypothetical protein
VIDLDSAFSQDLLEVAVGQTEPQIPTPRQQDQSSVLESPSWDL